MTSTLIRQHSMAGSTALYPMTNWTTSSTTSLIGLPPSTNPALAEAKRLVNRRTLPRVDDLIETQNSFLHAFTWPTLQKRGARLRARAAEVGPEFELRFSHYL